MQATYLIKKLKTTIDNKMVFDALMAQIESKSLSIATVINYSDIFIKKFPDTAIQKLIGFIINFSENPELIKKVNLNDIYTIQDLKLEVSKNRKVLKEKTIITDTYQNSVIRDLISNKFITSRDTTVILEDPIFHKYLILFKNNQNYANIFYGVYYLNRGAREFIELVARTISKTPEGNNILDTFQLNEGLELRKMAPSRNVGLSVVSNIRTLESLQDYYTNYVFNQLANYVFSNIYETVLEAGYSKDSLSELKNLVTLFLNGLLKDEMSFDNLDSLRIEYLKSKVYDSLIKKSIKVKSYNEYIGFLGAKNSDFAGFLNKLNSFEEGIDYNLIKTDFERNVLILQPLKFELTKLCVTGTNFCLADNDYNHSRYVEKGSVVLIYNFERFDEYRVVGLGFNFNLERDQFNDINDVSLADEEVSTYLKTIGLKLEDITSHLSNHHIDFSKLSTTDIESFLKANSFEKLKEMLSGAKDYTLDESVKMFSFSDGLLAFDQLNGIVMFLNHNYEFIKVYYKKGLMSFGSFYDEIKHLIDSEVVEKFKYLKSFKSFLVEQKAIQLNEFKEISKDEYETALYDVIPYADQIPSNDSLTYIKFEKSDVYFAYDETFNGVLVYGLFKKGPMTRQGIGEVSEFYEKLIELIRNNRNRLVAYTNDMSYNMLLKFKKYLDSKGIENNISSNKIGKIVNDYEDYYETMLTIK